MSTPSFDEAFSAHIERLEKATTTPTRTEFEAAAYRWMTEHFAVELLKHFPAPRPYCDATEVVHDAIAAAMGWPTVPERAPVSSCAPPAAP